MPQGTAEILTALGRPSGQSAATYATSLLTRLAYQAVTGQQGDGPEGNIEGTRERLGALLKLHDLSPVTSEEITGLPLETFLSSQALLAWLAEQRDFGKQPTQFGYKKLNFLAELLAVQPDYLIGLDPQVAPSLLSVREPVSADALVVALSVREQLRAGNYETRHLRVYGSGLNDAWVICAEQFRAKRVLTVEALIHVQRGEHQAGRLTLLAALQTLTGLKPRFFSTTSEAITGVQTGYLHPLAVPATELNEYSNEARHIGGSPNGFAPVTLNPLARQMLELWPALRNSEKPSDDAFSLALNLPSLR